MFIRLIMYNNGFGVKKKNQEAGTIEQSLNLLCRCSYLLIGLMDDPVEEPLWHLTGPVLPPLQRVVQVALGGGGNHRGNQGTDGPRCLK